MKAKIVVEVSLDILGSRDPNAQPDKDDGQMVAYMASYMLAALEYEAERYGAATPEAKLREASFDNGQTVDEVQEGGDEPVIDIVQLALSVKEDRFASWGLLCDAAHEAIVQEERPAEGFLKSAFLAYDDHATGQVLDIDEIMGKAFEAVKKHYVGSEGIVGDCIGVVSGRGLKAD